MAKTTYEGIMTPYGDYDSYWRWAVDIYERVTDEPSNSSIVDIYWYVGRQPNSGGASIYGKSYTSLYIDGVKKVNYRLRYLDNWCNEGAWIQIGYETITIPHNNDGTKSFILNATFELSDYSDEQELEGYFSQSPVHALTAINRAPAPVISQASVEMGDTVSISFTPKAQSLTHSAWFTTNNGTAERRGNVESPFSLDTGKLYSICKANGDNSQTEVTVTIEAKSNGVSCGTKTATFIVANPINVVPKLSSGTEISLETTDGTTIDGTPVYLQGRAKLQFAKSGINAGRNRTINTAKINNATSASVGSYFKAVSSVVSTSDTVTIQVTNDVGATAEFQGRTNIAVTAYFVPRIEDLDVYRSDKNGNKNPDKFIKVSYTARYQESLGQGIQNTKSVEYKISDGGPETIWTPLPSDGVIREIYQEEISLDKSYSIQLAILDKVTTEKDSANTNKYNASVAIATATLNLGADGKRVGIGRYARPTEENILDVGFLATFFGGLNVPENADARFHNATITDVTVGQIHFNDSHGDPQELIGSVNSLLSAASLINTIMNVPQSDGTYALKVTVEDGEPSYYWGEDSGGDDPGGDDPGGNDSDGEEYPYEE